MPTFSSNDRSRWATVRALVEEGTFVIGRRDPSKITDKNKYGDYGIVFEDGWGTVDKVMDPDTREFYSTKPPLLPILMAGSGLLQQKLAPTDPRQASSMYLMNVVMVVFFYNLPSGLVLYWTVMNLLTALQQWMVLRDGGGAPSVPAVAASGGRRR